MFYKSLPVDIRGVMIALLNFWGLVGMLSVTALSGPAFDLIGAAAPFAIIFVTDFLVFLVGVCLIYSGKLRS